MFFFYLCYSLNVKKDKMMFVSTCIIKWKALYEYVDVNDTCMNIRIFLSYKKNAFPRSRIRRANRELHQGR